MSRKQILMIPIILGVMLIASILGLAAILILLIPVMINPDLLTHFQDSATQKVTHEIMKYMMRASVKPIRVMSVKK